MSVRYARRSLAVAVTLVATLAGVTIVSCSAAPKISESDARARAVAFVEAVGWQHKGLSKAISPALPGIPASWEFSDETAVVLVDGDTGQVRSGLNRVALKESAPGRVTLTEERANNLAKDYLRKAGLARPDAEIESSKALSDNPQSAPDKWVVRFRRVYNGYPFYSRDFVLVTLNPGTGSLIAVGSNFRSPLPPSTKVTIKRDAAVNGARKYLAKRDVAAGDLVFANLMIVQPDNYWEYTGSGTPPRATDASRLAWVVQFNGPWEKTEVWIDALNGAPLGGVKSRSITKPTKVPEK